MPALWSRLCALPALWAGLLYDADAQAGAWDLCRHWTSEQRLALRAEVPRLALRASIDRRTAREIAKDMLTLARGGLKRRNRLSAGLVDEANYLNELDAIVESGVTDAERLLDLYHRRWNGDASRAFEFCAY